MSRTSGTHPRPRLALCTIAYRERLVEDALDIAAALGFEGVELWGREPHVGESYDYNRVRLCRRMCEDRRLQVAAFGSYLRFGATKRNPDTVDLLDTLHTVHTLRAPILRVWASDMPSAKADNVLWEQVLTEAREAAHRSRNLGVVLALEMHDDTLADTAESALRLVEEVGYDNFRLNFQPSALAGSEDPIERLAKVGKYVVHFHAQNFDHFGSANGDTPRRSPLRRGLINYRALIRALRDMDYCGWVALEFAPAEGEGKAEALAADLAYLQELVNY